MKERLMNILNGETENRILPFFWQHGEDNQTLLTELHTIYEAGIRSVCFESRPHEGFLTDAWWDDMRLLLDACGRLGMEAWILDDKCFPTGYANGALTAHPALCKRALTEKHMDVSGPIEDGAVLAEGWGDPKQEDRLFAVIACRCGAGDTLTGDRMDLTEATRIFSCPSWATSAISSMCSRRSSAAFSSARAEASRICPSRTCLRQAACLHR